MAPATRAWIRSKMAAIRKVSGIAFSEEIFLSMLICLIAKNKHLVLHTAPEAVPELKAVVEQHSAVVFGLTTATIVCHRQQTRPDIIGAITGRHADITASTPSAQHPFPTSSYIGSLHPSSSTSATGVGGAHHSHHRQSTSSGQYYQYSNPADEYTQRSAKLRFENSRRSIATNHSGASEYSFRPSEKNVTPSIASFRTASERDQDVSSIRRGHHRQQDSGDYSRGGGDDISITLRRSESRPKSSGDAMTDHILHSRSRKSNVVSSLHPNSTDMDSSISGGFRRTGAQSLQVASHLSASPSISSGPAPVTPVDFTFPRRRHESISNAVGYGGPGGDVSGVTYSGRRLAQAIILEGLENASQEVYAVLLEMIVNKEINDRNRYVLPDLIIIAIFTSPNIPDNIPKQLEWDELSRRMKAVTISNDMRRYIRDVVVAIRTHEAVQGGLTPRAALDLEAILKTLAAIFQTTFVTPDLLTIAAEKVFSHRLELKSTRRRKMFAAAAAVEGGTSTAQGGSPFSSLPSSPMSPMHTSSQRVHHGKTPIRGYNTTGKHQRESRPRMRRNSSGSAQSSDSNGGASFVEISDSADDDGDDDDDDSGSVVIHDDEGEPSQDRQDKSQRGHAAASPASVSSLPPDMDTMAIAADDKTAADVVRDVLRAVYPPI
ncbi:hypothetical protein EDD11_001047 [Mortierella claussenii]|nr:hypothetical protein EDD11_001047 [Mortierella claussenii]